MLHILSCVWSLVNERQFWTADSDRRKSQFTGEELQVKFFSDFCYVIENDGRPVGLELMKITGGAVSMPLLHLTDRQFVQLFDFVHSRFCSNCLQTLNYLGIPATLGIHLPDGYIPLLGC